VQVRRSEVDAGALDRTITQIFGSARTRWERTPDGVATEVFRIFRDRNTFYLRLAEDDASSLSVEASVHTELRRLGVNVPEVVHYEPFDEGLRRSVLVTTEIPGRPMASYGVGGALVSTDLPDAADVPRIYRAAGRDLALVNQVAVDGFGHIQRDGNGWPLRAEYQDFALWAAADFDPLAIQRFGFSEAEARQVERIVADDRRQAPPAGQGLLAHGDFDVSQVFHRDGEYTGMIDFGGIKGSNGWYDLATFRLCDPQLAIPEEATIPHLEAGYAEVANLSPDHQWRVHGTAVTIVAGRLSRGYRRDGEIARAQSWFRDHCQHLRQLLDTTQP
jgi:aminoglycoside phosphotransferase (APT) family kinase protein